MGKGMKLLKAILSILILLALVSVATTAIFDWNLLFLIAFKNAIAYKIIAGVIGAVGIFTLGSMLFDVFK